MNIKLNYLLYGINYWFKTKICKMHIPFIGGMVINERCNLHCTHCKVANRNIPDLTYNDVKNGLEIFYKMGIRKEY